MRFALAASCAAWTAGMLLPESDVTCRANAVRTVQKEVLFPWVSSAAFRFTPRSPRTAAINRAICGDTPSTVTMKLDVTEFPAESVATHETWFSPIGNTLPEAGVHTIAGASPELSVAVAL